MARKDDAEPIAEAPANDPRCAAEYGGLRCAYHWTISHSTGGKYGLCRQHFGLEYGSRYRQIIDESHSKTGVKAHANA